jgi:DNA polymerase-3 subunit beta
MSLDQQSPEERTLLIPGKALQEVHRIGSREEKKVIRWTFSPQLKQLFFAVDEVEMVIRLMEGDFPPYQKIMPESFTTQVEIDPDQLLASLKGAMVFAREASHIIKLSFDADQLTISAASPTLGNHQSTVPIKLRSGQPNEIAFNVHYLVELLQTAKPKTLKLLMNESLQPAQFEIDGNQNYRYIVMPFRVNG